MNITPQKLTEDINRISEEYYRLSQELAEISGRKDIMWLEIRRDNSVQNKSPSNGLVDKLWGATADGRREAYLRIYLRGLEKLRGARVLEHKANMGGSF